MQPNLSSVIIDSDTNSRTAIETFFKPFGDTVKVLGSVADFQSGLQIIQSKSPAVVIMEAKELERGADQIRQIYSRSPRASVFVTACEKNPGWILTLMRAGAVEYLLRPVESTELLQAFQKVGKFLAPKPAEALPEGKIISVYNPIGGMGTTTIAVNLAAALAAKDEKVALVDLNLFSGDVTTFLDVNPKYTLSSITTNLDRLDASFLMTVMTRHVTGVYVLGEPLEVEETINITPEHIHRLLSFLKRAFSYVVIDTGGQLLGGNLVVFKDSDCVLFNTVLNLPALNNTKRYLLAMEKQGLTKHTVKVVVNRYSPKADIKVVDAEKVLDTKVFFTIPNEYTHVMASINRGIPVVRHTPKSPVSSAIASLADSFRNIKQEVKNTRG